MEQKSRAGFSLVEISLSIGILIAAGAVAYYFLYFLPQQNSAGSISVKVTPPSQAQSAPAVTPAAPAQPAQVPLTEEQLNQSFVIDNVQYEVQAVKNLGNQLASYTQPSQGTYLQVEFTAENVGTQTVTVKPIFYLMDSESRQFQTASAIMWEEPSGYTIYDSSYGDSSYGMSFSPISLQPGFSQKLVALFNVPLSSSGFKLVMANGTSQNFYVPLGL